MTSIKGLANFSLDSSLVRLAQMVGARAFMHIMNFIVMIVLARKLGPTAFGVYAFAVLIGASLGELVLGAGMDMAAVRLSAPYWRDDPEQAWAVFQVVGLVKVVLGLSIIAIGFVSMDWISGFLLHYAEAPLAVHTACLAALPLSLTEFALAIFQARQHFGSLAVLSFGVAIVRATPILALTASPGLTVSTALPVYVWSLYLGCALVLAPSIRCLVSTWGTYRRLFKDVLDYVGWLTLATMIAALTNSLDTLALSYFNGAAAVGLYAAARTFTIGIAVPTMATFAVLLPRFGGMRDHVERRQGLVRASRPLIGAAGIIVCAEFVLAPLLVQGFYGDGYLEAVPVLRVLAFVYSLDLAAITLIVFFLGEGRPDILAKANAIGLFAVLGGYIWLVPPFGALGAALALLSGRMVALAACLIWLLLLVSSNVRNYHLSSEERFDA